MNETISEKNKAIKAFDKVRNLTMGVLVSTAATAGLGIVDKPVLAAAAFLIATGLGCRLFHHTAKGAEAILESVPKTPNLT